MRRAEKEIKNPGEIIGILDRCETVRIGLSGPEYPYIVPMSFGYEFTNGSLMLYVHGAKEGFKHDLIHQNSKVCIEADIFHRYARTERGVTTEYESIVGYGVIETANHDDSIKGIDLLMKHCNVEGFSAAQCVQLGITTVLKITVESFTGKRSFVG